MLYLGLLDPVVAPGESQCSEEYFTRTAKHHGVAKCKQ